MRAGVWIAGLALLFLLYATSIAAARGVDSGLVARGDRPLLRRTPVESADAGAQPPLPARASEVLIRRGHGAWQVRLGSPPPAVSLVPAWDWPEVGVAAGLGALVATCYSLVVRRRRG